MYENRIRKTDLEQLIITAEEAAMLFKDKMVVASSGFTKAGDSKAVLMALAERAKVDPLKVTLMTGASLGQGTDGALAEADALSLRLPFQVDPIMRKAINKGEVFFIDQHLGETANLLRANNFPKIDIAILEAPDTATTAIANHLIRFFNQEVAKGNLSKSLLPLQAGIGKVANAVLTGFTHSDFEDLTMYSEVLQDSTFDLLDSGKLLFASGSSITVSQEYYDRIFGDFDKYKDRVMLRPQDISNAAEVIRRLGIIAINTAVECDIYGNVNSTHVSGTHMMNGIGGSGDFARNSYLSIFVTTSVAKGDKISCIVPMVSHVDHCEHDVDIIVTERGLADLRGLAPRQRAQVIIDKCVHPEYQEEMQSYFDRACAERGGQTPHILEEAFSWHTSLRENGSMKKVVMA